jgi:denticleless
MGEQTRLYYGYGTEQSRSILLKWDLRSVREAKQAVEESFEDPSVAFTSSRRPRGITSIGLGTNDSMIYGLGTDGNVHSYLTKTLQACRSLPPPSSNIGSLQFSCKLSTSPCGRWLATGSTNGRVYLRDISSHQSAFDRAPIALHGHGEKLTGPSWANGEVVRTFP